MTYFALTTALLLSLGATPESQLERVDPDVEVPGVTVDELARAVAETGPPVLIDVRLMEDFEADPVLIPEASWRDPNAIDTWAKELSKETPVVVYCVAGRWVSQSVTKKLIDLGYDVAQLNGGIEAWAEAGEPTKPANDP